MEPLDQRSPYPKCGTHGRTVDKLLAAEVRATASMSYDAFPKGTTSKKHRFAWGFTGWGFSHALQRLVRKDSVFNKRSNRRYEHIEDPETGQVLHHQRPSAHRAQGAWIGSAAA